MLEGLTGAKVKYDHSDKIIVSYQNVLIQVLRYFHYLKVYLPFYTYIMIDAVVHDVDEVKE